MIEVGLTAVAEHPSLAANGKASTLAELAAYFPVVEIDAGFYAVPRLTTVQRWLTQVPAGFRFIVKATQTITTHNRPELTAILADLAALKTAMAPLRESGQLAAVLLQWPPYFGVNPKNVRYLRWLRQQLPDWPLAVEFRNNSWYLPVYRESTLGLLRELGLIHVVVDEPQTASGSVPLVAEATADLTIMRLHGRNQAGWLANGPNWRGERTNYRYDDDALRALGTVAKGLAGKQVIVIFNNNGGGDAAANALRFIALNGLHFDGLAPRQMGLF